jgi:hypothetical protein
MAAGITAAVRVTAAGKTLAGRVTAGGINAAPATMAMIIPAITTATRTSATAIPAATTLTAGNYNKFRLIKKSCLNSLQTQANIIGHKKAKTPLVERGFLLLCFRDPVFRKNRVPI